MRDFVYVSDIASMCLWLMEHKPASGLYNAGTGKARTYKDLATAIFDSLGMEPNIVYVDTPLDIRDKYQYFTEADMGKLQAAGYQQPFYSIEQGVADYLPYLQDGRKYF
jgi:ADP-L-glycero-D-manno-heptose 6-epimerase